MEQEIKVNHEIELLKLEYRECQNGYNSRDKMAEDEFCKVIQVFSIFLTILVAFNIFAEFGTFTYYAICSIIGVTGLMCLVSLLVVIESNTSCKVALRQRCKDIKEKINFLVGYQLEYWQRIEHRARYMEEKQIKGGILGKNDKKEKHEAEYNMFVYAVRLLIILWIAIVIATTLVTRLQKITFTF